MPSRSLFTVVLAALPLLTSAADGPKPIFETPLMTSTSLPRVAEIDVPIKGAKELFLAVSAEGSFSCDWADWLEPKLVMADGSVKSVTELSWKMATSGFRKAQVGRSVGGRPLSVERQTYELGIGTNATSVIIYELPEGAERFQARVAIDDGGMIRAGQPSDASLKFAIYTERPAHRTEGDGARAARGAGRSLHRAGGPGGHAMGNFPDAL